MEKQVKVGSDFILFSWMVVLVVVVGVSCTPDSEINPRIDVKDDKSKVDYTILIEEEYHGEILHLENRIRK